MTNIVLGIDGSGPLTTGAYQHMMRNSFVNYIIRHSPSHLKRYLRGPGFDGLDMGAIVAQGYTFVNLCKAANPHASVLLTGYSRGGSGVIDVAARLARVGVQVDGMMLFDAVDRSLTSSGDTIPNNVLRVAHARRHENSYSRFTFSGCGNHWHHPTRCDVKPFWCTHGGVGGIPGTPDPGVRRTEFISEGFPEPWPTLVTYNQDVDGAREVWAWVSPRIRSMGFL